MKKFATLLANNQLAKTMLAARFDIIEFVYSLMAPSCCRQKKFHLNVKTKLIGAGVRDSCGKSASKGDPAGAGAEEAPGPPAESECLEWKSTFLHFLKKTVGNSLLSKFCNVPQWHLLFRYMGRLAMTLL
ncbi:hypothetical protein MRBL20_001442 [Peribacillus frigoritolerans]